MDGIASVSTALATQSVQQVAALRSLQQSNAVQESAMSLLEGTMELMTQMLRESFGAAMDVYA